MLKILQTLRNNWKKTVFFSGVGYFGGAYGYEKYRAFMMMRELSQEAKLQGKRPLPIGSRNKHITLILNPVSCNRKGKGKFEKFGEPLIHLSGFLVNIVKTERISEARDLVGLIEKTNIITVVGGDGSLMEVVTGLLRRDDADEAVRRYPIAVIPGGIHNTFANKLFDPDHSHKSEKDVIAEAAMSIGRHHIGAQDVVEITQVEPKTEEKPASEMEVESVELVESKPTENKVEEPVKVEDKDAAIDKSHKPYYSMTGLELGDFREADKIEMSLPMMFNRKLCAIWSFLRAPREIIKAEIRYVPYCEGCLRCKEEPLNAKGQSLLSRIFSVFRPSVHTDLEKSGAQDEKWSVENTDCGTWESICVEGPELNILARGEGKLEIQVGSKLSRLKFIQEGYRRRFQGKYNFSNTIPCREVEILPISSPEFCSIDNDEFPVIPLKMKVLRKKVYFFTQ